MTKVDAEIAQEFLRLRDLGHSYVDIGNRFDVNHRTVSDWVKRARGFIQKRHWQEIVHGLDAKYMDEHHQLLLAAGRGILTAVNTPLSLVEQGQLPAVLIDYHVMTSLQNSEELLAKRGLKAALDELSDFDYALLEGMAVKLREGLFQHLPELRVAADLWVSHWQAFRARRDTLVKETTGALEQSGRTAEAAHELAQHAVGIALTREFGDGGNGRVNVSQTGEDLDSAVGQVIPRMDSIRDAREGIRAAVATCRSQVEDLVLRGGPSGRCPSCPEGAWQ